MNRICVTFFPLDCPSPWMRGMGISLSNASFYKRNPRDERYMRNVVTQIFDAEIPFISVTDLRPESFHQVEEVILLWPDGNGYGWYGVEQRVFHWKASGCRVFVINGRKRNFVLTPMVKLTYRWRRFAERFWLGEIVFSILFVVLSPFLLIWDFVRGRNSDRK